MFCFYCAFPDNLGEKKRTVTLKKEKNCKSQMHFTLALFQIKEMVNHLHSKPLAVQLVYQKRLFSIQCLLSKSNSQTAA